MNRLLQAVREYPVVAATLAVGAVGLALWGAGHEPAARWAVSVFALAVAAWQAVGMVRELIKGKAGVDALAIIAITATVLVGEYWAALVIVLMLSGGEALEDYAAGRARRELTALLDLAPRIAHVLDGDEVRDVPVDEVPLGARVLVRPGEVIPVDGELLDANATLDESSLTGESLPVEKRAGDALMSGSINEQVALTLRSTRLAADSQYQQLVSLVAQAEQAKAPMVRLADRYAVPFTALALLLAGTAWAITGEPVRFAEVLVVATPCPLLIAAPVAFIAGMSRCTKNGVIVKGGGVLECLARVRTAAFDKTGTLTRGEPHVVAVDAADADRVLTLAASAEQYSAHVLAAAIVADAKARGLEMVTGQDAVERTGFGVTARLGDADVLVGKLALLTEAGVAVTAPPPGPGEIAVYVAVGGTYAGRVILADEVRPDARSTLAELRRLGVEHLTMLTGDSAATALHIASELGIDQVKANCLPQQKVDVVRALTDRPVMVVGDGVNDAPMLAVADVGVAMGARGSSAASESADVVIVLDDIHRSAVAVAIAKRTTRVALESIWVGIAMSVALMIVATFGLLPAIAGAGLQEVVDLVAILGALRAVRPGRAERSAQPSVMTSVPAGGAAASAVQASVSRSQT